MIRNPNFGVLNRPNAMLLNPPLDRRFRCKADIDGHAGATGRQRHRNYALRCRIACETDRARARNSARREHGRAAYKFEGPKGATPKIVAADVDRPDDIEVALRELANKRADVVIVLETNLFVTYTPEIGTAALAMKLPTVCGYREHVVEGALISHGVDLSWCFQRSGYFIDKIHNRAVCCGA
jgi:hypothetical protein